ncbi:SDR family oxidoreductase [Yinghuangia sp. ASG 101]|uniref:SDR family NAD(P)-dependent oxidoreductase n=1 Tax=Yinghuangia sp. ASG 101 TaxID=2896848 RepID=UPI001E5D3037|nr:glucose 1-dehydrogenase [Yinghuangia sp. ASG 101]UGQ09241.1 SDR family oxidoreductase [Yinghuangia sp. ASG 101]
MGDQHTRPPNHRTAIVTGAAQGIGAATARALLHAGAYVGLLDRDPDALDRRVRALRDLLPDHAERLLPQVTDVTDEEAVRTAVSAVADRFGGLDILVNNAGVNAYYDPAAMTEAEWDKVFAVDLKAAWLCAKHAIPLLRRGTDPAIVNVASLHARLTARGYFPYAAAKSGLIGLTRSLALELAPDGIRVNAVSPGWTRTQLVADYFAAQPDPRAAEAAVLAQHPLGRMCDPADVANVVAFLTGPGARGMTGAEVPVDAGLGIRFAG